MSSAYVQGSFLLFDFYFKNLSKIKSLPKWMRNPDLLMLEFEDSSGKAKKSFSLRYSIVHMLGKMVFRNSWAWSHQIAHLHCEGIQW